MIFGRLRLHLVSRLSALAIVASAALVAVPHPAGAHPAGSAGDPQCAAHGSHQAAVGHAHGGPAAPGPSIAASAEGGCSHCAVTACAFVSPCGAAGTALAVARTTERLAPRLSASSLGTWRPSRSRTQEPPTPPPHTLLS
jgi:hypothetical protein